MSFDPQSEAMNAPAVRPQPANCMAAVRTLNRLRRAGFTLRLTGDSLQIAPIDRLNEQQRAFIREHKPALVQLLKDAETVHEALQAAGTAGIGWHEGTPPEWTDARLLAAGEVLYSDGRMVNRLDKRYCTESAPPALVEQPDIPSQQPPAGAIAAQWRNSGTEPNDTPAIPAAPAKTPKCVWGRWGDRLVMKCSAPEPNADGTGCANCGEVKP